MKCTLAEAEAIIRLQALPEWNTFLNMLGRHASDTNELLIMKDEVNTDILRGELRGFTRIVGAIEAASNVIAQSQQPKT